MSFKKVDLSAYKYFAREKKSYFAIGFFSVLGTVFTAVVPYSAGKIVDWMKEHYFDFNNYAKLIAVTAVLALSAYVICSSTGMALDKKALYSYSMARKDMFNAILQRSNRFFAKYTVGEIMSRFSDDVGDLGDFLSWGFICLMKSVFVVAFICLFIYFQMGLLPVLIILPLFLTFPLVTYLNVKIVDSYDEAQAAVDNVNKCVYELVDAIRLARAFNMEKYFDLRFGAANKNLFKKTMKKNILIIMWGETVELLRLLVIAIMLISGVYLVAQSYITVGQLLSLSMYIGILAYPMAFFSDLITLTLEGGAANKRINDIINAEKDLPVDLDSAVPTAIPPLESLELRNFSFRYPDSEEAVLQNINIKLRKGMTLGIVGKTGSGKSTLIKALLQLWPIAKGQIYLNGEDITDSALTLYRAYFSYVPQDHLLFSMSVRDNLLFAKSAASDAEIAQALDFADFAKDVKEMPAGLDTLIGEKGLTLSGGQKQRLSLARAILVDPAILLLDDALSAVDTKTEQRILTHLQQRCARTNDKISLIVAHRISAVRAADLIIVLDKGEIIEQGTHETLVAANGLYAELHRNQTEDKCEDNEAI